MTEQQRKVFEAWYNDEYVRPIIPADRTEGGYQHPDAQAAWDAWQAALSHAEGEAVDHWAVRNPGLADQFRAEAQTVRKRLGFEPDADDVSPNDLRERIDKIEGAPQVVFSDTQEEIEARLADQLENSCPYCRGSGHKDDVAAPQVAVPEPVGWVKWFDGEASFQPRDAILPEDAKQHGWQLVGLMRSLNAPTAPAGELRPDCSVCGDFGSDCDVCGAPSQQPVSDPDGLPEPLCYLNPKVIDWDTGKLKRGLGALTYSTDNPADNWKVPVYLSAPAPDEREIAVDQYYKDRRAYRDLVQDAERYRWLRDPRATVSLLNAARWTNGEEMDRAVDAARLRAGKEGETS